MFPIKRCSYTSVFCIHTYSSSCPALYFIVCCSCALFRSLSHSFSVSLPLSQYINKYNKYTHKHTFTIHFMIPVRCIRSPFTTMAMWFFSSSSSSSNAHTDLYETFFTTVKSYGIVNKFCKWNETKRNIADTE